MTTNTAFFRFNKFSIALVLLTLLLTACGGGDNMLSLSGTVVDSNGVPVPNAMVTIHSDPVVVHTDRYGAFSCRIPAGNHHIRAEKEGRVFLEKDFTANREAGIDHHELGELTPTIPHYDVHVTLSGIAISPATATVEIGQNAAFIATATYSDASTTDLTSKVKWSSANTAIATINTSTGIATGVGLGSTSVSASFYGIAATAASIIVAPAAPPAPAAPSVTVSVTSPKTLSFNWSSVSGATSYKLLKSTDGVVAYSQVGADLPDTAIQATDVIGVHVHDWVNARYIVQACNAGGCTDSNAVSTATEMIAAIGYVKASNTGSNDRFGFSVALSADGYTLAVGAWSEDSSTSGINSTPDELASDAGAVYVYSRSGSTWTQQAYVKAGNTGAGDQFGYSVALSADGNTLAVGAYNEDSSSTGINSTPDEAATNAGAVYVYSRSGSTWTQQAYVKAGNTGAVDQFGESGARSADGNTLAVGANGEDSSSTGINSTPDELASDAGAVYVYSRNGSTWIQQAYVKASNTGAGDTFGTSVELSADGNTLAVGAQGEASSSTGINSTPDELASYAGAVYVYSRSGSTWTQQAYVKASNTGAVDLFGYAVALSADGNTLAVGALFEASSSTGINSTPDDLASLAGAVYVYSRSGSTWTQQAYVKASNTGAADFFGTSVALSADGNTLAVGARSEDSSTSGINSTPDELASDAGAVYVYSRNGSTWIQQSYVKASNTGAYDQFSYAVALSADGNTLAVGAYNEDSSSTGINSTPDDASFSTGAVYLY